VTPLSAAQRRLWLLSELDGPGAAYNVPLALRLTGDLAPGALADALRDVAHRHEALRTVFPRNAEGDPYQRIVPTAALPVLPETVNCSPGALDKELATESGRPFDLAREVPLRAVLYRCGPRDHVLLLVLHHIAFDGASADPLLTDLATAWSARLAGTAPGWSELPVRYTDYTAWQRELLGDRDDPASLAHAQAAYWRDRLAGAPEELPLPLAGHRPRVSSHRAVSARLTLSPHVHRRLAEVATAERATLFMVFQAALAALYTRLGCGDDIPLGTPSAGRDEQHLQDMVGFFANTLVLRTDTSRRPAYRALVRRVRAADIADYAHQEIPFDHVVEAVRPARARSGNPLFQVMLVLQEDDGASVFRVGGVEAAVERVSFVTSRFDVTVVVREHTDKEGRPAGVTCEFVLAEDLFDQDAARRLCDWFGVLLRDMASSPDSRPEDLVLDGVEAQVPATGGAPTPATLPDLFESQVRRSPDATAVVFAEAAWTYAQLNARANRLAHALIGLGIGPEDRIAVRLPPGGDALTALLGIMKAGAAYQPLDAAYPEARVASLLADAPPRLFLDSRTALDALIEGARGGHGDDTGGNPGDTERNRPLRILNTAYVIHTSGSTGRPKGVAVTHHGVAGLARAHAAGPGARVLQFCSLGFDGSMAEVCMALLSGAALVVPPETDRTGGELLDFLRTRGITHAALPAAVLPTLPDRPAPELRTLVVAGDRPSPAALARWSAGRRLLNAYGPTEATCTVTQSAPLDASGDAPIGPPVDGVRVYVLNASLRPQPHGVTGELYVAGGGLARGYLGRAGATATRFVADPFGPLGGRMYRTGDLGRRRADGALEFVGRADSQVKVRGFRVELGEIEAALDVHPEVARSAVTVREDGSGDRYLAAYVVPATAPAPAPAALRAHLARSLPEAMVPSAFVLLGELPLTVHGKLDRNALPDPSVDGGSRPHRPSSSSVQDILCGLFADVLGKRWVGPDDNFYDLGGHSLKAAELLGRLRTALGVEVPLRDLLEVPTVRGVLDRVATGPSSGKTALQPVLSLRTRGSRPPLYCFAPGGGRAWCYAGLLPYVPAGHPVYGFQSFALSRSVDRRPKSVREVARAYAEEILSLHPGGPLHLVGWSYGGVVAHAVARELHGLGRETGLLMLLDSHHGGGAVPPLDDDLARRVAFDGRPATDAGTDGPGGPSPTVLLDAVRENDRLMRAHRPGRFHGDMVFVEAVPDVPRTGPVSDTWTSAVTGRIDLHRLDCDHQDMLRPPWLQRIGALLSRELERHTGPRTFGLHW